MWFSTRLISLFANKLNKDILWRVYVTGLVYITKIFKLGVSVVTRQFGGGDSKFSQRYLK